MDTGGVVRVAALFCGLSLGWSPAAQAVDPFYERLKEDGIQAYNRGDYAAAAVDLRLACFGMLEEPPALAHCLVLLALSQAETGDDGTLGHTFDRISDLERDFEAFSQLDLDPDRRRSLEKHLKRAIPYDKLRRLPPFHDIARQQLEEQIDSMPDDEKRSELKQRIESEPEYSTWRLLLAELDYEDGDFAAAQAAAEAVLLREPGRQDALCLRGKTSAKSGSCDQALIDLGHCLESEPQGDLNLTRIQCHISLGDWDTAEFVLGELSGSDVRPATLRQLTREIKRGRKATTATGDAAALAEPSPRPIVEEATLEEPLAAASAEPTETAGLEPGEALELDEPKAARAEIERLVELLQTGTRDDLEAVQSEAHRLADDNPQQIEVQLLAAEIAYRLSRWDAAITYFDRAGVFESGRPEHQFYLAVSLYESGDRATAQEMLRICLPQLEQTEFVRVYSQRIGSSGN